MVDTAAPGSGCHRVGAGRQSRMCGQQDELRGRHSWCGSPRAPSLDLGIGYPDLLRFHLSVVRDVARDYMDGGLNSGESLGLSGRC
jgi:hypothetical protein